VGAIALAAVVFSGGPAHAGEPPRLVLQITVDALRGDLPQRFDSVLGEGRFRYLVNEGIHYNNAHYQHANTETIVGHTSLAMGTVPAAHGMVANVWFDRGQGGLADGSVRDKRFLSNQHAFGWMPRDISCVPSLSQTGNQQ
jgi:predicted AlkP superfamily pyrophosphatase or phosphodiesterase